MEIFEKNKKIFIFIGIFLLIVIIYLMIPSSSNNAPVKSSLSPTSSGLVSELSVSPSDLVIGRELLTLFGQLKSIRLDGSIFVDKVFQSLMDSDKPIDKQALGRTLGRRNPFSDFASTQVVNTSDSLKTSSSTPGIVR